MYTAKSVIDNIDNALKSAEISKAKMCIDLNINRNTINKMTDKNGISSFIEESADYSSALSS